VPLCFRIGSKVLLHLGWAGDNNRMQKRRRGRNPLFAKRWFSDDVIITCVRRYLRFRLSYRDLASIAAELGIAVATSTILR
jgi:transposase-like protein